MKSFREKSLLAITVVLGAIGGPAGAAEMTIESHSVVSTVSHANLTGDPGAGGVLVGAASGFKGSVYRYSSADPNGHLFAGQSELVDLDKTTGALQARGSYGIRATSFGSAQGLRYTTSADIHTELTGFVGSTAPAPQVEFETVASTEFSVSANTSARLLGVLNGSTNSGTNFVELTLGHVDAAGIFRHAPETLRPLAYPRVPGDNTHVVSTDVSLVSGRTYTIEGETNGRHSATAHTPYPPPSTLTYSLLLSQDPTGTSELNSLKPNDTTAEGHRFLLDSVQLDSLAGGTVWIDPAVAIGFDYLVDGAGVLGITLPSYSVFPESDYELYDLGGDLLANLSAGDSFSFASAVTGFALRGISEALAIDPLAPGFTLGMNFDQSTRGTVLVMQTPVTANVPGATVAAPGMVPLLLLGLGGLVVVRRREHSR